MIFQRYLAIQVLILVNYAVCSSPFSLDDDIGFETNIFMTLEAVPDSPRAVARELSVFRHSLNKAIATHDRELPLHYAVRKENVQAVLWLLQNGARNDLTDAYDLTPRAYAIDCRNTLQTRLAGMAVGATHPALLERLKKLNTIIRILDFGLLTPPF